MTVEKQSYIQPPANRIPVADQDHQRHRHAQGLERPRPGLRDLRPLRLPGHRRAELHQRRARRRRRRVRCRGLDGAGPGPGDARARGHDRVGRRRRRGAGSLRIRPHGRAVRRTPARTCRACSPTTSSAARPPTTASVTRTSLRLFAEGVPTDETDGGGRHPRVGRRRERLPGPAARAVRHRGRRQPRHRDATCGSSTGATASCAAATRSRSSSAATRPRASPSRTRTSRTSTRTCASRTACSSATCRSSATSTTSRGWPG